MTSSWRLWGARRPTKRTIGGPAGPPGAGGGARAPGGAGVVQQPRVAVGGLDPAHAPPPAAGAVARVDERRPARAPPAPGREALAPGERLARHGVVRAGAAEDLVDDHRSESERSSSSASR